MAKCEIINQAGQVVGEKDLPDSVFGVDFNGGLVHQVVVSARACRQMGTASSKTRSQVNGSGAKPFRQKGTGMARQGTRYAPHMKGGSIAWGPVPHRRVRKNGKKMRAGAIRSMLSQRLREDRLKVVESLNVASGKTRELGSVLKTIGVLDQDVVLIQPERDEGLLRASRNLPGARVALANTLSAALLVDSDVLLATPEAIDMIVEVYGK